MHATDPVDDQHDLACLLIDVGDHLLDEGAHDALLQACICRWSRPDGLEVRGEWGKRYAADAEAGEWADGGWVAGGGQWRDATDVRR